MVSPISYINRSGSITVANVSQVLMAANNGRKGYIIQNLSDTDMYINFDDAADLGVNSFKLMPNDSVTPPVGFISTGVITIICSAPNKIFVAKEY